MWVHYVRFYGIIIRGNKREKTDFYCSLLLSVTLTPTLLLVANSNYMSVSHRSAVIATGIIFVLGYLITRLKMRTARTHTSPGPGTIFFFNIEWLPPWVTGNPSTKNEVDRFNIVWDILLTDIQTKTHKVRDSNKPYPAKLGLGLIRVSGSLVLCFTFSKMTPSYNIRSADKCRWDDLITFKVPAFFNSADCQKRIASIYADCQSKPSTRLEKEPFWRYSRFMDIPLTSENLQSAPNALKRYWNNHAWNTCIPKHTHLITSRITLFHPFCCTISHFPVSCHSGHI